MPLSMVNPQPPPKTPTPPRASPNANQSDDGGVQRLGHDLHFPNDRWTCPVTDTTVKMDLLGNAEQRQDLWAACKNDPDLQARVMALCAQSFKVWCCLFAWTYVVFEVKETGERVAKTDEKDVPFILWPTQMAAFDEMDTAWRKGDDSAVQKSREMGASWLVLAWFVWLAIFHGSELGVASRKEDLVEKTGNPDALFTKIDYPVSYTHLTLPTNREV